MRFHKQLKQYWEESGLTQSEIAKRAQIAPSTFDRYVSGQRTPGDFLTVIRLTMAFGWSEDDERTRKLVELAHFPVEWIPGMYAKQITLNEENSRQNGSMHTKPSTKKVRV